MNSIVKIRYNTSVSDDQLYWRILIDGVERLASDIEVNVPTVTTRDFIKGVGYKHHLTCQPDIISWCGDKVILVNRTKKVSKIRHILKSITYRVYSSCITALIASLVTENFKLGVSIGTADFFIKLITYYIHERVWYRIPYGTEKAKK
jgi:uncharacterized membrane protein